MSNTLIGHWWFWLAVVLVGAVVLLAALFKKLIPVPRRIVAQHSLHGEKLVVLFGDSITEGMMSSNYVDLLEQRMGHENYRFLNAGVGGDTAYNLLNRLSPIVESQQCPPVQWSYHRVYLILIFIVAFVPMISARSTSSSSLILIGINWVTLVYVPEVVKLMAEPVSFAEVTLLTSST
jgi:hypothetical protein